jgi:hypothetical protein
LEYMSNNAPSKEKILGTILLSILAGHKRYAHMTSVRADKVLPASLRSEWSDRLLRNRDRFAQELVIGLAGIRTISLIWRGMHLGAASGGTISSICSTGI